MNPAPDRRAPLHLCGLCQTWNSKPCGEQCGFSLCDPTWEQHLAANPAKPDDAVLAEGLTPLSSTDDQIQAPKDHPND